MSEQVGTTGVEIARAWTTPGQDGSVYIVLQSGEDHIQVKVQRARNPRMYEFLVNHATMSSAPERPESATTDDGAADDADSGAALDTGLE